MVPRSLIAAVTKSHTDLEPLGRVENLVRHRFRAGWATPGLLGVVLGMAPAAVNAQAMGGGSSLGGYGAAPGTSVALPTAGGGGSVAPFGGRFGSVVVGDPMGLDRLNDGPQTFAPLSRGRAPFTIGPTGIRASQGLGRRSFVLPDRKPLVPGRQPGTSQPIWRSGGPNVMPPRLGSPFRDPPRLLAPEGSGGGGSM